MKLNERRAALLAESKSGWDVIEEWNNMTEKQKKPYEKIAKQNMEKYFEEMEKKEKTDNIIKKTKENHQKKKKITDPNKPKKPASSFILFNKEARKNLLEERN
ncbi:unnamed protein product [Camellia sinensis]